MEFLGFTLQPFPPIKLQLAFQLNLGTAMIKLETSLSTTRLRHLFFDKSSHLWLTSSGRPRVEKQGKFEGKASLATDGYPSRWHRRSTFFRAWRLRFQILFIVLGGSAMMPVFYFSWERKAKSIWTVPWSNIRTKCTVISNSASSHTGSRPCIGIGWPR